MTLDAFSEQRFHSLPPQARGLPQRLWFHPSPSTVTLLAWRTLHRLLSFRKSDFGFWKLNVKFNHKDCWNVNALLSLSHIISVSLKWNEISRKSGTQHSISNYKRKCHIISFILLHNSHHCPVCGHETVLCIAFTFRGYELRKSSRAALHFWTHLPTIPVEVQYSPYL